MKRRMYQRLITLSIIVSMLLAMIPCQTVFAESEENNETIQTAISPEPADEILATDVENVIRPIETDTTHNDLNSQVTEKNNLDENRAENGETNTEKSQEERKRPYEVVDVLPSEKLRQEERNSLDAASKQSGATRTSYDDRSLYFINELKQNSYSPKETQGVSVNPTNGNVSYKYNIASVPGKNGSVLSLDIEYNSTESSFVKALADVTDARDYYMTPYLAYEAEDSLGAGWKFSNLKRICDDYGRYVLLKDGNVVDVNCTQTTDYSYYTIYDNHITYIDGTVEYLNDEGYLQYVDDKYGNRITYTYEDYTNVENESAIRLTSISDNLGRSITIDYYTNYVEITKPDETIIRLNTQDIPVEHIAQDRGFDMTLPAKEIKSIYNVTDSKYVAFFDYTSFYYEYVFGYGGYQIMIDDYNVSMAMTSYTPYFSDCHYFNYAITADNQNFPQIPSYNSKYWYLTVTEDYTDSARTSLRKSYTYDIEDTEERSCTEINCNNMVTTTSIDDYNYTQEISERTGSTDVLHLKIENNFEKYKRKDRPSYVITKKYNSNGNYITSRQDNTYDTYGNITQSVEKVEGSTKIQRDYTYYTNSYKSLKDVTVRKGTTVFNKICYTVNSIGDVIYEQIYDGSNNLQRKTYYTYSNNNLSSKTIYKDTTTTILQKENYTYTGPYMTNVYTTNAGGTAIASKNYAYDINTGRVTSTSDVNQTETLEYDSIGRIRKEIHADGTYKTIGYEYIEEALCITDETGYHYEYWYNDLGEVSKITEKDSSWNWTDLKRITYDNLGNPTAVKDALNNTTNITYDAFGRQISVKYPGNTVSAKAKYYDVFLEGSEKYSVYLTISETGRIACEYYDIYGRLSKTAVVANYSAFTESDFDNIYQMPANVQLIITSHYVYDDLDRLIEEYDGENRPTYFTYDSIGNVTNMTKGASGSTQISVSYEYDSAGNVVKTTQGTHITTYEYDRAGRLTKMTDPMGYTETYTYDTAGNVLTKKDRNGSYTTNTYNNRGLLSSAVKGTKTIQYTYNAVGEILTSTDENGIITYTYNYDGTPASRTYPDGKQIAYTAYNANKALTSMTDYLGNTTTYTYNARGAVTSVGEKYYGTSTTNTTNYEYNTDGSLQKITYPLSYYMTSNYTYDYAGRVSTLTNKRTSSATYSTHNYTYDNSGNVTQKAETINGTSKTTTYAYDSLNHLSSETYSGVGSITYTYDQYGNLSTEDGLNHIWYYYDKNNRLTFINDQNSEKITANGMQTSLWESSLSYDNNGNLLTYNTSSYAPPYLDSSQKSYTYDEWGRLTNFSDNLGETASYTYYSDGLRASKTIGSNTTKYYYDGDHVINETVNGNSYATNVLGINGYISRRQNSTTGYLFKDAHGDVLAAFSGTTTKVADYTYDAWGKPMSENETSSFTNNPLRYCGEYYDTESGMTYLRARYYDNSIRRFITEDPAKDGVNWYVYCGGNPVMRVDPLGLVDIPEGDTKPYNELIAALLELIDAKTNYINEDAKGRNKNQDLLNQYHRDAKHTREAKIKLNKALWYSDALSDVVKGVALYSEDGGDIQELSSIIALAMDLRDKITTAIHPDVGDEIMSEDDVWDNYLRYRKSNRVYLTYSTLYPMNADLLAQKILSEGYTTYFHGGKITYIGRNGYGERCEVVMLSGGTATFSELEDWPMKGI